MALPILLTHTFYSLQTPHMYLLHDKEIWRFKTPNIGIYEVFNVYIPVYSYPNLAINLHSPKAAHSLTCTCDTQYNKTPSSTAFPQCNLDWSS